MNVKDEERLMGVIEFHNDTADKVLVASCGGGMKFLP